MLVALPHKIGILINANGQNQSFHVIVIAVSHLLRR